MILSHQLFLVVACFVQACFSLMTPSDFERINGMLAPEAYSSTSVPFPAWLAQLANRTDWPAAKPPFIQTPGLDINSGIPSNPLHSLRLDQDMACFSQCSFDCNNCLGPNDIAACPQLLQTFDDGPTAATPALLDYLRQKRQLTSFFIIGTQVLSFPDTLRAERRAGHFIGSHTWTHPYLPSLSNQDIAAELQWTTWVINVTAGVVPRYFRPPYGGLDDRVRAIAERMGLTPIVWAHDTNDWQMVGGTRTENQTLADVQSWINASSTGIMLEHDQAPITVNTGMKIRDMVGAQMYVAPACKSLTAPWYN
ncbi:hypothetical protein BZA70DRAFT_268195 [Myxozyma melibiosi]|uniref:chitin deacetylase n=1 Tax=Myxozyma melibiosi TaxID=54550 RepID=A0ABR1F5D8_9ASCO